MEDCSQVSYPISIALQPSGLQKPKTPKLTPLNVPRGIGSMIGVDSTDIRSKANAAKSSTAKGVAGRNMVGAIQICVAIREVDWCWCSQRPQDAARSSWRSPVSEGQISPLPCLF